MHELITFAGRDWWVVDSKLLHLFWVSQSEEVFFYFRLMLNCLFLQSEKFWCTHP